MYEYTGNKKSSFVKTPKNRQAPKEEIDSEKKTSSGKETFVRLFVFFSVSIVLVLFGVGLIGLAILYQVTTKDLSQEVFNKELQLLEKKEELNNLNFVEIDFNSLDKYSQKLLKALPSKKDLPSLIIELQAIAEKNKIAMRNFELAGADIVGDTENEDSQLMKLVFKLELSGSDYYTLKNYLQDIENDLRVMDVQSILYSPTTSMYELELFTYYWEDEPSTLSNTAGNDLQKSEWFESLEQKGVWPVTIEDISKEKQNPFEQEM